MTALKEYMYGKLDETYGLGNKAMNLREYFKKRSPGKSSIKFGTEDCNILNLLDELPLENKYEQRFYDTSHLKNGAIINVIGQDTSEEMETPPTEITEEKHFNDRRTTGYLKLIETGRWLSCLKLQSKPDSFLTEYLIVKEAVGELSERKFAESMAKKHTYYFAEHPIAELIVIMEFYYRELKKNKC